jgi:phosphatidylinositol-3-phosphatase
VQAIRRRRRGRIEAMSRYRRFPLLLIALAAAACSSGTTSTPSGTSTAAIAPAPAYQSTLTVTAGPLPKVAHVVVVVLENHAEGEVIGTAPYLTSLARHGADFTRSYAISHPSEPNYLALFSGSTQGVSSDACPVTFTAPNLAADLLAAGKTFGGYSEGLPATGDQTCLQGNYARKHVPWTDFSNVPGSVSRPFTAWPARDFSKLPAVSFVIPDLCDDMHNCPVATGDAWVKKNLSSYVTWAMTHHSLLVLTWDEDDGSGPNQIPTIIIGQPVRPGSYATRITHYSVLRTIEDLFGLRHDGAAATAHPITNIWR